MRVAFVGKGGAGKSAIAGTFARALARTGASVLAVDSDPMPGLAFSIGVSADDTPLPDDLVVETPESATGSRYRLRPDLTAADAVERYAAHGPDGVRFLQFGKLRAHVSALARSQFTFRALLAELPPDRWSLVGDLPGGTRQPAFGWGDFADTFVVVVEPSPKSMLAAKRILTILERRNPSTMRCAVANRVLEDSDASRIGQRLGVEVIASVPADGAIAAADRAGRAPIDHAPDAPAVRAVIELAHRLADRLPSPSPW